MFSTPQQTLLCRNVFSSVSFISQSSRQCEVDRAWFIHTSRITMRITQETLTLVPTHLIPPLPLSTQTAALVRPEAETAAPRRSCSESPPSALAVALPGGGYPDVVAINSRTIGIIIIIFCNRFIQCVIEKQILREAYIVATTMANNLIIVSDCWCFLPNDCEKQNRYGW